MRSSKSRTRSKQNRPRTIGNIINRVFESSGPEGKVRGTPQQVIEKYQQLARDAQLSNDRVAAENFLQHAEHYTRMLGEATREMAAEQEARQQQNAQNGGQGGNGSNHQGGGQSRDTNQNRDNNNQNQNRDNQNAGRDPHQPRDRDQKRDPQQNRDPNQTRDQNQIRDQRQPAREDRASASDDQGADAVMDMSADTGLVDTPEARAPRAEPDAAPRREPRQPASDRGPRGTSDLPRRERTPRPQAANTGSETDTSTPPDQAKSAEPGAVPDVDATAAQVAKPAAKPRRARVPKKPKETVADQAQPDFGLTDKISD